MYNTHATQTRENDNGLTIERRSPDRLCFACDWRRTFGAKETAIASVDEGENIFVWMGSPTFINNSKSARNILTADERNDFGFITQSEQRDASVAARVLLRIALSAATSGKVPAADWRFKRTRQGRPIVRDGLPAFWFSVSHCASAVAVAISRQLPVGIDIESADETLSTQTRRAFLNDRELIDIASLGGAQQMRESLRLWTLKEALFKALGHSHELGPYAFNFSRRPASAQVPYRDSAIDGAGHFETIYMAVPGDLCLASLAVPAVDGISRSGVIQLVKLQSEPLRSHRGLIAS